MSIRTLATVAVAIFLGLIAVLVVRHYIGAGQSADVQGQAGGTTPVVVASAQIQRGAPLRPDMLKVVAYPRNAVPAGAFQSVNQVAGAKRLALRPISANEPILADRVTGLGAKPNLSAVLSPGMRAVSIKSDDVIGVAGFALPGDHVDVLGTRTVGQGQDATSLTEALAENVRVLGVDQSDTNEKPTVGRSVTVEVTPEQAQAISLAQSIGAVSLSLRQMGDGAALARRVTTVADLASIKRTQAAAPDKTASDKTAGRAKPDKTIEVKSRAAGQRTVEVHVTRGVETAGYPVAVN